MNRDLNRQRSLRAEISTDRDLYWQRSLWTEISAGRDLFEQGSLWAEIPTQKTLRTDISTYNKNAARRAEGTIYSSLVGFPKDKTIGWATACSYPTLKENTPNLVKRLRMKFTP